MLERITDLLSANQLTRNISAMVSGNAIARAVGILALPAITRLYSPDDFGELAVFVSSLGILSPFVTLRYSVALPLSKLDSVAVNLFTLCIALTIAAVALVALIFGAFAFFAGTVSMPDVPQYWWAFLICLFGAGLYESLSGWAMRRSRLAPVAKTMVYQSIGSAATKVILGLMGLKPIGLIVGHVVGVVLRSLVLAANFGRDVRSQLSRASLSRMRLVARMYAEFPKFRLPSQFLLAVSAQTPILFSAWLFSDAVTGQLSLALVIVGLPITLLGKAVGQSLYAEVARLGTERSSEVRKICITILRQMAVLMVALMLVLVSAGPFLFDVVFGDVWRPAGEYSRILAVYMAAQLCAIPLMNVFNVFGGQATFLIANVIRVVLIVGVFGVASLIGLDDKETVSLFSVVLSLYFVLLIRKILLILDRDAG